MLATASSLLVAVLALVPRVALTLQFLDPNNQQGPAAVSENSEPSSTAAEFEGRTAALLKSIRKEDLLKNLSALMPDPNYPIKDHIAKRRWLGARLHSEELSEGVVDKVREYAGWYADAFQQSKMVYFSHVSKSAGTTFCMCGQVSGCIGSGMEIGQDPVVLNCHNPIDSDETPDDRPHWAAERLHPAEFDKCQGLLNYASINGYTLEGNENYMIGDRLCWDFWNVLMFREPLDRLVSHMRELSNIPTGNKFSEVETGPEIWNPASITPEIMFDKAPMISDNFYIRSLLGVDVARLPFGSITEEHLEEAKRRVGSYDLVFVVTRELINDFNRHMGWTCPQAAITRFTADGYHDRLHATWTDKQWETLVWQNRFDRALYEHAANLFLLDKLVLDHEQFQVERRCGTNECGYLCKAGDADLTNYLNASLAWMWTR